MVHWKFRILTSLPLSLVILNPPPCPPTCSPFSVPKEQVCRAKLILLFEGLLKCILFHCTPHSLQGSWWVGGDWGNPISAAQWEAKASEQLFIKGAELELQILGMGAHNQMRSIFGNESGIHVCASVCDWQNCRLIATGRALALGHGVRKGYGCFFIRQTFGKWPQQI